MTQRNMPNECDQIIADLSVFLSRIAVIPINEITAQDSLGTLGIDSAAIISLSAHLEEQYGVIADADDLPRTATLSHICDFVLQKRSG